MSFVCGFALKRKARFFTKKRIVLVPIFYYNKIKQDYFKKIKKGRGVHHREG